MVNPVNENDLDAQMCNICAEFYKKTDFFSLPKCDHKYCKNCMKNHLSVNIKDGKVLNINCMDFNCK